MNWSQRIVQITSVLPYVIMGIQQIHADAKGSDKKTLALESLGLSSAVAQVVDPNDAAKIQAVSSLVGSQIDQIVTALHTLNAPGFGSNAAKA